MKGVMARLDLIYKLYTIALVMVESHPHSRDIFMGFYKYA
jgi:hypothetical protein